MNAQVKRWKDNEHYQALMRQVHVDIYVGLKNGVSAKECKQALKELAKEIEDSVQWSPLNPTWK